MIRLSSRLSAGDLRLDLAQNQSFFKGLRAGSDNADKFHTMHSKTLRRRRLCFAGFIRKPAKKSSQSGQSCLKKCSDRIYRIYKIICLPRCGSQIRYPLCGEKLSICQMEIPMAPGISSRGRNGRCHGPWVFAWLRPATMQKNPVNPCLPRVWRGKSCLKEIFRQDQQDIQDIFPDFPEENRETSATGKAVSKTRSYMSGLYKLSSGRGSSRLCFHSFIWKL